MMIFDDDDWYYLFVAFIKSKILKLYKDLVYLIEY